MKNSIGTSVILTVFGESHGPAIGAVLDGLAPGIKVDNNKIAEMLNRRRPNGKTDTTRIEKDEFQILSGVYNGYTTGTPICIIIPNNNQNSGDYESWRGLARPSHADYTGYLKYHGFEDYRGGGHFSGRITAGIVALGSICKEALENKGIYIGSHILECGKVKDKNFSGKVEEINSLKNNSFPVLDNVQKQMEDEILQAKEKNDSVGGIIETMVLGFPGGVGEPLFDNVESAISKGILAIGGIKGIEFGDGFALTKVKGSEAMDTFRMDNGKVVTTTNHSGGINGGITNGMPVIFKAAVKPTASLTRPVDTVDYINGKNAELNLVGRHDPSIVRRIVVVIEAMTAIIMCDLLALRYGTDYLK